MINESGTLGGVRISKETKVLGEKTKWHFVHHKCCMTRPGTEPGPSS
jgi:hypothetical protein